MKFDNLGKKKTWKFEQKTWKNLEFLTVYHVQ